MHVHGWGLLFVGLLAGCGGAEATIAPVNQLPTARVRSATPALAQVVPLTPTPRPHVFLPAVARYPVAAPEATITSTPLPIPEVAPSAAAEPAAQDPATLEALLVAAINQQRADNGLLPYTHNPVLSAAARAHSCDLAAHGLISHVSSDGRTLTQRLEGSDPPWEWPSESIAAGSDDPAVIVAMWMDEPPEGWHRRNILATDQREVGAGFCYTAEDATGNHFYWTADFSRHPS